MVLKWDVQYISGLEYHLSEMGRKWVDSSKESTNLDVGICIALTSHQHPLLFKESAAGLWEGSMG